MKRRYTGKGPSRKQMAYLNGVILGEFDYVQGMDRIMGNQ